MNREVIRRRSKIDTELPPEVRREVDRLLVEDATYEEIAAYLAAKGYEISKSAVGRYGKEFLRLVQNVRMMEAKAQTLVGEEDNLALEEASTKLLLHQVLDGVMNKTIDVKDMPRILSDVAKLQSSAVGREKFKADFRAKADKAMEKIEKKASGITPETLNIIREEIYGLAPR